MLVVAFISVQTIVITIKTYQYQILIRFLNDDLRS